MNKDQFRALKNTEPGQVFNLESARLFNPNDEHDAAGKLHDLHQRTRLRALLGNDAPERLITEYSPIVSVAEKLYHGIPQDQLCSLIQTLDQPNSRGSITRRVWDSKDLTLISKLNFMANTLPSIAKEINIFKETIFPNPNEIDINTAKELFKSHFVDHAINSPERLVETSEAIRQEHIKEDAKSYFPFMVAVVSGLLTVGGASALLIDNPSTTSDVANELLAKWTLLANLTCIVSSVITAKINRNVSNLKSWGQYYSHAAHGIISNTKGAK